MVYITQLIFIKEGKASTFLEFEKHALPLMAEYRGKLLYRLRPGPESFVDEEKELPYEIHFITFDRQEDLDAFMKDDRRLTYLHLKKASVKSTILIKGEAM